VIRSCRPGIVMFFTAAAFGYLVTRQRERVPAT